MNHFHRPYNRPPWLKRIIWRFYWSRIIELICYGFLTVVLLYLAWLIIKTILGIRIVGG